MSAKPSSYAAAVPLSLLSECCLSSPSSADKILFQIEHFMINKMGCITFESVFSVCVCALTPGLFFQLHVSEYGPQKKRFY